MRLLGYLSDEILKASFQLNRPRAPSTYPPTKLPTHSTGESPTPHPAVSLQLIRQVQQQRSNRRKSLIAISNQHFTAGIVSNAEQRRRVWGRRLQRFCPRVEVVINRTMRRLIQFQVGTVPQPCTRGGVESDTGVSGSSASCMADSAFSL